MAKNPSTLRPTRGWAAPVAPPGPASTAIFERQVLVFPLLVVVLACASFLFGGRCAAWPWWIAVAAVVAAPFVQKDRRRSALGAAGLFALLLFALRCLIPPVVWDHPSPSDMQSCHLPMIQLLIEGWNPVADPMAKEITASLGLDPWGMAHLHIAFSMKALAVFSAVAFKYIGDPYALTFPLPLFLWLGVFLSGIRAFRGFARWAVFAAIVFVLPMVARQMPVDLALAFASCGLLFTMRDALRRKKCDWVVLGIWAAWMMNLKLNGVLGLAIFAAAFAVAKIRKERGERKRWLARFAAWFSIMLLVTGLISWNPLGTSWRRYGHPLYPYRTVDAERFPAMDLAWDMQLGNNDLRLMGRTARFAHAYLSPTATVAFLRWKLGRSDFDPECEWWRLNGYLPDAYVRFELWLAFFFLLLVPAGRPWGIGGIVLLFLVPLPMIGYTRYQPWLSALGCLAVVLGLERAGQLLTESLQKKLSFVVGTVLCLAFFVFMKDKSEAIECKTVEVRTIHKEIRPNFAWMPGYLFQMVSSVKHFVPRLNYLSFTENRCHLLVKERGLDQTTKVVSESLREHPHLHRFCFDERELQIHETKKSSAFQDESSWKMDAPCFSDEHDRLVLFQALGREAKRWTKGWILTPFGYYVPDDEHAKHYHLFLEKDAYSDEQTVWCRLRMRCGSFFHAWFVTYPKEVWHRISGRPDMNLQSHR